MADLKKVYQAINEDEAMNALLEFKEKWQKTYPSCVKSWKDNWDIFYVFLGQFRKIADLIPGRFSNKFSALSFRPKQQRSHSLINIFVLSFFEFPLIPLFDPH